MNARWMLMGIVLLVAPKIVDACPTSLKCVCDCNAKCMYGETCKQVKECKIYKSCKTVKVCSWGNQTCCSWHKSSVCHIPPGNPANAHTICVDQSAVPAHLNHGDYLGKCQGGCKTKTVCKSVKCCKTVKKCECNKHNPKCPPCYCPKQDAGVAKDAAVVKPDAKVVKPDAFVKTDAKRPDAVVLRQDSSVFRPDAKVVKHDSTVTKSDYSVAFPDLEVVEVDAGCPNCPVGTEDDLELVGGGGCSVVGNTGVGLGLILGVILFIVGLVKRRLWLVIVSVVIIAVSSCGNVWAAPPVNNFKTAPGFDDYYTTMTSKTLGHLDFNAQLVLNYAHKPLRVIDKATGGTVDTVIRYRMNVDIAMALGLFDWLELGVVVPMSAGQGAGNLESLKTELSVHDFELADMKDMRIVPKATLLSVSLTDTTVFRLGVALPITAPTGDRDRLLGENGPTLTPTLLAGLDHKRFSIGLNVGVLTRHGQYYEFRNQNIANDNSFLYGVGADLTLVEDYSVLRKLSLVGDMWGSVELNQQDKEEIGLEAMAGLRGRFKGGIVMNVAAGGGITKGYGVPEYRVLWGFGWEFDYQKPEACPDCVCKGCVNVVRTVKIVERVVPVIKEKVLIIPPVYFDTDKSILRPDAVKTLNETVDLLKANPWVKKVRLEGHCDFRASNKYNEALGLRRVGAVRDYLVSHDIPMKKLEARGYGETQSVNDSKVEPGLQKNRRVEFHVLEVE